MKTRSGNKVAYFVSSNEGDRFPIKGFIYNKDGVEDAEWTASGKYALTKTALPLDLVRDDEVSVNRYNTFLSAALLALSLLVTYVCLEAAYLINVEMRFHQDRILEVIGHDN